MFDNYLIQKSIITENKKAMWLKMKYKKSVFFLKEYKEWFVHKHCFFPMSTRDTYILSSYKFAFDTVEKAHISELYPLGSTDHHSKQFHQTKAQP